MKAVALGILFWAGCINPIYWAGMVLFVVLYAASGNKS